MGSSDAGYAALDNAVRTSRRTGAQGTCGRTGGACATVERVGQLGGQLNVSCLIATEIDPPSGVKPVQWRLLTNLAVSSLQYSAELIDWYRARWEIELFFLILNEGCRVEQLQLGNIEQLQSALAIYLVISWRINRLMRLGRALPDLPVDLLFERAEWRTAFILNKKPVPKQVPTINTVIRLIAQRGGGVWAASMMASQAPARCGRAYANLADSEAPMRSTRLRWRRRTR